MKVIYTMNGHTQDATCCCIININNKMIGCSCSKDESIKTWDLNKGTIISDIRQNSSIFLSLSYRKDSIYLFCILLLIDEHNKVYIYCTTSSGEYIDLFIFKNSVLVYEMNNEGILSLLVKTEQMNNGNVKNDAGFSNI